MSMSSFEAARLPNEAMRGWFVQATADLTGADTDLLGTLQSVLWMPLLFHQKLNDLVEDISLLRQGSGC